MEIDGLNTTIGGRNVLVQAHDPEVIWLEVENLNATTTTVGLMPEESIAVAEMLFRKGHEGLALRKVQEDALIG